ncbi:IS1595 family transposase [Myroides sp. N17-2]|uniref:IS1595 family transposase n=1 Tax=Myroides sp. N17-2 TaxID=2030799 RepID=UPI000EFAAC19|nr:IS1595 family transposase [Myroides sp. N17-2]
MKLSELKTIILSLSESERLTLLEDIQTEVNVSSLNTGIEYSRRNLLNNKQGSCPHCGHSKYVKFGFKSNSQRYKCKSCHKSFTEYSGTWMAGIHHKDKITNYLELMVEEKSLDKIKVSLAINKKTAFDWRHKILASLSDQSKGGFIGVTESDETFFLSSEKGSSALDRKSRKRGGKSKKKGISNDQVAVLVTQDRNSSMDITVATMGRLKKKDIANAIGTRIKPNETILCSDAHVSYKGFAIDNKIEHHPLKVAIKQRVKNKIFHIQHVNSTHNKIKKWINNTFWGVSTKYLQQYLNWFRIKEQIKGAKDILKEFALKTILDTKAYLSFKHISKRYQELISTQ